MAKIPGGRLAAYGVFLVVWLALSSLPARSGDNPNGEPKKGQAKKGDGTKKADPKKLNDKIKEIAGSAEFLGGVPKHFATLKAVDPARNQVTLLIEGEVLPKIWPLVPDAEIKVLGWWGRLGDFTLGDRVWIWFKTDRKKQAVAISMIADELSQQDINGMPYTVEKMEAGGKNPVVVFKLFKGKARTLGIDKALLPSLVDKLAVKEKLYIQSRDGKIRLALTAKELPAVRDKQKQVQRQRWAKDGLPGTIGFIHVFSGEMDLILDHETMRWARSLQVGDKVTLHADPPIKALVKNVQTWRERTQVRLVVKSFDLAELAAGQRIALIRMPPSPEVENAALPPDVDRPRATKKERIEWFMASIYCTCGVAGDRCTGHFYTLASCNPNGCGMPNLMRGILAEKIDEGKTDRQIFEELIEGQGPHLLKPHLLP